MCLREGVRVAAATGDWRRRGPITAPLGATACRSPVAAGWRGGAHLRRGLVPAGPAVGVAPPPRPPCWGGVRSSCHSPLRAGSAPHGGPWRGRPLAVLLWRLGHSSGCFPAHRRQRLTGAKSRCSASKQASKTLRGKLHCPATTLSSKKNWSRCLLNRARSSLL